MFCVYCKHLSIWLSTLSSYWYTLCYVLFPGAAVLLVFGRASWAVLLAWGADPGRRLIYFFKFLVDFNGTLFDGA